MKKSMIYFFTAMVVVVMTAAIASCGSDDPKQDYNPLIDDPQPAEQPVVPDGSAVERTEQYRPQIHFTPAKNWMNDPNGMVYIDGVYHLFYQYNPQGNDWGNMSWGHATSADLIHWTEQPVALTRDELGDIFSGSAVIDKQNTTGFGANAMVALYTSASSVQQQSIAYSTDGGKTFNRYSGNPVIRNNDDNLRDPKVFWHETTQKWVMALAKGWKMGVEFYGSTDLKNWSHLSTFVTDLPGRPSLQWECPDLIEMELGGLGDSSFSRLGDSSVSGLGDSSFSRLGEVTNIPKQPNNQTTKRPTKWVLLVSVNPGGPILGSGTMYFVGDFDGKEFKADALEYPLWLDYGMDNYAGVTWSNTGDRKLMIGWMNNWQYAGSVPCSPWRSAMTLPRELKLTEYNGKPLLCCPVIPEIDKIAGQWQTLTVQGDLQSPQLLPLTADRAAYQLRLTLNLDKNSTITLSNDANEKYVIDINAAARTLTAHRTAASGKTSFNGSFSIPSMQAPLNVSGNAVTLDLFIDQSSVELLTNDGAVSMTNLVFPQTIYDRLTVTGANCEAQYRSLSSIWN